MMLEMSAFSRQIHRSLNAPYYSSAPLTSLLCNLSDPLAGSACSAWRAAVQRAAFTETKRSTWKKKGVI